MQVDILLSCGDILAIPVESVLLLPKVGESIKCKFCNANHSIIQIGTPYRSEHIAKNENPDQKSMLGE